MARSVADVRWIYSSADNLSDGSGGAESFELLFREPGFFQGITRVLAKSGRCGFRRVVIAGEAHGRGRREIGAAAILFRHLYIGAGRMGLRVGKHIGGAHERCPDDVLRIELLAPVFNIMLDE